MFRGEIFVSAVDGGRDEADHQHAVAGAERELQPRRPDASCMPRRSTTPGTCTRARSCARRSRTSTSRRCSRKSPSVATPAEEYQPAFSPDGKEVAYLEDRVTLKVVNLASKQTRTILPARLELLVCRWRSVLPVVSRREVVPGPVRPTRSGCSAPRSAWSPPTARARSTTSRSVRLRRLRAEVGHGREGDDLGLDARGHAPAGRGCRERRRLRDVLHPRGLRPLPALQGRVRAAEGAGGRAGEEEEGGRRGEQGQEGEEERGGEGQGGRECRENGGRHRLGQPDRSQGQAHGPYLSGRRLDPVQGRREALLPDHGSRRATTSG